MFLSQKIKDIYKYSELNLEIVGFLGSAAFLLYYIVWEFIFPQPYESLILRLFCSLLFVPLIIKDNMPMIFKKYQHYYFLGAITICLPFFFSFMMLKNEWSTVWSLSFMVSIFLVILLLYDWTIIVISSCVGYLAAFLSVYILDGAVSYLHFDPAFVPIFILSYFAGILFNHRNKIEHEGKLTLARSLGSGMAYEMKGPLDSVYSSMEVVKELLPKKKGKSAAGYTISENDLEQVLAIVNDSMSVIDRGNESVSLLLSSIDEQSITSESFKKYSINGVINEVINGYSYQSPIDKQCINLTSLMNKDDFFGSDLLLRNVISTLLKSAFAYKESPGFNIDISLLNTEHSNTIKIYITGFGISKKELRYIFEDFYVTNQKAGFGVGFPFCKKIITAFGGEIRCDSLLDSWLEFSLELPTYNSDQVAQLKSEAIVNKKVLYVGAKSESLSILQGHAFYSGYQFESKSRKSVCSWLEEQKKVDVIIVDLDSFVSDWACFEVLENKLLSVQSRVVYLYSQVVPSQYRLNRMVSFELVDKQVNRHYFLNKLDKLFFEPAKGESKQAFSNFSAIQPKVMIVDDNISLRTYSGILLEKQGYQVVHAEHGVAALDYLEKEHIDLILMDLEMPLMGGIEATKQIRNDGRFKGKQQVPIICFTGDKQEGVLETVMASGMDDYLPKPASKTTLLSKVSGWV